MRLKRRPTVEHRYFKESKREVLLDKEYPKQQVERVVVGLTRILGSRGYQEGVNYRVEKMYPDRVYIGIPYRHGEMGEVDRVLKEALRELSQRVVLE